MHCGRDQAFLLPPDLRDWIPEDDLAHFVIEAVERVDMGAFKVNRRGTGSAQYHPRMMLALPREIARREAYEAKAAARAGRKGRAKGKRPKPPEGTPRGDEQSNLSDPDSRLMRKSKRHEFRQAYNAQAVVDAGGSQRLDHATAPVHFPVAIDTRLGLTQSGCPGWTVCGREGSRAAAPSRRSIRRPQGRGVSRCRNLPCGSRPRAS